ncbi:MAG: acyltransferase family protein [Paracoccaceae bacterium]
MTQHASSPVHRSARAAHLDTLRALACIALVSYHVVGHTSRTGMELNADHWLVLFNDTFVDMRMPLFSFLSGCVFLSLEQLTRSPGQLLLSKARRLLVPMLSVGLLFWSANMLIGQQQPHVLSLFVLPYAHFWFLQATFLIMVCFLLLYAILPVRSTTLALGLLGVGMLVWVAGLHPPVNVFSVIQAAYLMPFFMLGYLCAHSTLLPRLRAVLSPLTAITVLLILVGFGHALATSHMEMASLVDRRAVTIGIGMLFCVSLLVIAPRHPALAQLGGYSYTIYLFHVFFTAGSFEILGQIAPATPDAAVWVVGLVLGLAGPIILHRVLMQNDLLAALFLGLKLNPRSIQRTPAVAQTGAEQRA